MKFTSETGKAARQRWQELYGGGDLHRQWSSQGYWATAAKLGWERTNLKCFGQHLSRKKALQLRATGYRQKSIKW